MANEPPAATALARLHRRFGCPTCWLYGLLAAWRTLWYRTGTTVVPGVVARIRELEAENERLRTALQTIVTTTKLGGAADIARRALGSRFVK